MVGDELDPVFRLQHPFGEVAVATGAFGAGERSVRDVAHELRLEAEGAVLDDQEIAVGEGVEHALGRVDRCERQRVGDEAVGADHSKILEQRSLRRRERVETGRDETVQCRRKHADPRRRRGGAGVLDLADERDELLDEERIASAAFEQEGEHVVGERLAEELSSKARGRIGVERVDVHDERVVMASRQGPALLETRSRGSDEHERKVSQPLEESFDQIEHEIVGPVEVGQREHEWRAARVTFEVRRHRPHRVVACAPARPRAGRTLRGCRAVLRRPARSRTPRARRARSRRRV